VKARVFVTGLGVISAAGRGVAALQDALREGRSGLRPLSRFVPRDLPALPVGEVPALPGPDDGRPSTHRLAMAAAQDAFLDAALAARVPRARIAVVVGTTTGGIGNSETWFMRKLAGETAPPELLFDHPAITVGHAAAAQVGAAGLCLALSTACSSGANALLTGADLLRAGAADVVLAGGADGLCQLPFIGFHSLRLLSEAPCRPFDVARDGLNLGEAGAFLVLETEAHARARGARVHAELAGAANTCDAHHMTAPAPDGAQVVRAMQAALTEAGARPDEVAYVNAHGTATPANDAAEAAALRRLFGDRVPPTSSSKSMLGHTLGAAGALEALITVLAVRDGWLPPTVGTQAPLEGAPPDLVLGRGRAADVPLAMSNSFAFGGNNAVVVLRRVDR
jgi:3-oxoacyl-[acyl-carrier-protein] synthase II